MSMWDPFTERARLALRSAVEEARRLGAPAICPEHVLLGLIDDAESDVARILRDALVTPELLRSWMPPMSESSVEQDLSSIDFSASAKTLVREMFDIATKSQIAYVGEPQSPTITPEHMALALLAEPDLVARLGAAAVNIPALRTQMWQSIADADARPHAASVPTAGRDQELVEKIRPEPMIRAQHEAQLLGTNFVGSEHILLSLLSLPESPVAVLLAKHGLTRDIALAELLRVFGPGDRTPTAEMVFTPRAKRVIEAGFEEARRFQSGYIGPAHLLLGLLNESDGAAGRVMTNLHVNTAQVRAETERLLAAD